MNLDHLLKPEHRRQGLHLEDDEDFVYLIKDDEGIGIYRAWTEKKEILGDADRYLAATELQRAQWRIRAR